MSDTQDGRDPDVGSLAEEATKLLGALNGWAREQGGGLAESVSGVSEHATATAHDVSSHFATGAAECTVCPVCRAVHAARHLNPDAKNHLASAAASLMHAAAAVLATEVPAERSAEGDGIEHIDLDDAADAWPDADPA